MTPSIAGGKVNAEKATRNGLNIHTLTTNIICSKALRLSKAIEHKKRIYSEPKIPTSLLRTVGIHLSVSHLLF